MTIHLLLWLVVGSILGFVTFESLGALLGIIAGALIHISDQLRIIISELKKSRATP